MGLCISPSLLGNGSVNTFQQQRRIVGGVVFYVIRVLSNECRPIFLPRTSCYCSSLNDINQDSHPQKKEVKLQ
jgi:hypothetical protein